MGIFDGAKDTLSDIDFDEPHEWKNGFDPEVCRGCEHHKTEGSGPNTCGLCGCFTTAPMAPMRLTGAPPRSCPYLSEHADEDA